MQIIIISTSFDKSYMYVLWSRNIDSSSTIPQTHYHFPFPFPFDVFYSLFQFLFIILFSEHLMKMNCVTHNVKRAAKIWINNVPQ